MDKGGENVKKRILAVGLVMLLLLAFTGCSDPKRNAVDTNIQTQMRQGTLNAED